MMPRHHLLLGPGLALLLALGAAKAAAVTVTVQGDVLTPGPHTLAESSRLLDAIHQAQPGADAYWLGAHYARQNQLPQQAQLKDEVLTRLHERQTAASGDRATRTAACLDDLERQIAALPVTGRLPQVLDPDTLDLDSRANRRLQEGDHLFIPARPDYVLVQGLVQHEAKLPYRHGRLAAEYLAQAALCTGADPSHAWVIYPDGTTRHIGIAYWNEEPVNLAPGARILVPLAERRWDDSAQVLNALMAEFLATQPLP